MIQHAALFPRLSVMMFLQFFVWGSWYVSMTGWMNAAGLGPLVGWAYTVGPIAAIVSPFFVGMIADRFFPTQIVLAVLHVLGGAVMLAVPTAAIAAGPATEASFTHPYILLLLAHMLCYMPTLALTNSLSFSHLASAPRSFPLIRVFGTIGWIAGNIAVAGSLAQWGASGLTWIADGDKSPAQFYIAGAAGIVLGLYCLTLPHTPAPARGKSISAREVLGLDSLKLLSRPSYAVFIACSLLLCIPLAGYYAFARTYVDQTGFQNATLTMSYGQMAEIVFMVLMPAFFVRLGVKWMLAAGMLAWVVRYGLFGAAAHDHVMWMVLLGVVLHGICYDFFFVTGFIYVDRVAPPAMRAQAQGFLVLVTQGLGLGIGAQLFGGLVGNYTTGPEGAKVTDWQSVWYIAAAFALAVLLLFIALFRERVGEPVESRQS
ncbi:MAG: MFS transporter [Phycisphaeraceae bacterium]|nr:MFS transporter [Phycisphaeraceae bacterium]